MSCAGLINSIFGASVRLVAGPVKEIFFPSTSFILLHLQVVLRLRGPCACSLAVFVLYFLCLEFILCMKESFSYLRIVTTLGKQWGLAVCFSVVSCVSGQ